MAKRKPDVRRDTEKLKDLLDIYRDGGNVAAIVILNDGQTIGVHLAGNGARILSTCALGAGNIIHQMAKNDSSAIELAEKMGALIPAHVRELSGDRSVMDALHATICNNDD